MHAIVGSGFGLYGYLPAVVEGLGGEVVLPRAAEEKLRTRPELAASLRGTHFVDHLADALARADTVIVATPPARQVEVVAACLALPNVKQLVLEKPLAPTPAEAAALLEQIEAAGRRVRVGYSLLHTTWHDSFAWPVCPEQPQLIELRWTFKAHHFAYGVRTWKRQRDEGGGVLRFFGIHVAALLAFHGYETVVASTLESSQPGEPERWTATFRGEALPDCQVFVDSRSDTPVFTIEETESGIARMLLALRDPFDREVAPGAHDRRVPLLERLLRSFDADDAALLALYRGTNRLWAAAESA